MARSLNRVQLIGNLTRDPELRYTPQGTGVCTFGLATNRSWTTDSGDKKEEADFHKIVAWNKLGELCSQLLTKGRKVYVEGRLSTRSWTGQDGVQKTTTEIVIDDMIILDSRKEGVAVHEADMSYEEPVEEVEVEKPVKKVKKEKVEEKAEFEDVNPDDIPF
ncbi:MAG: single-stranded DNA-binding protein [Candidatus Levybacteria bacterium]|nr:single-stranded DNA-binding protein [Candidatus Levybacteria bacterium]